MGQYYKGVIFTKSSRKQKNNKIKACLDNWAYKNGAKLMEHSYVGIVMFVHTNISLQNDMMVILSFGLAIMLMTTMAKMYMTLHISIVNSSPIERQKARF